MSRRSHHPARRHVRPHVEPRPVRPAGPGEPPAAEAVGGPAAGPLPVQTQAQVAPAARVMPAEVAPAPAPAPARSPSAAALADEVPALEPVPIEPPVVEAMPIATDAPDTPVAPRVAPGRPAPVGAPPVMARTAAPAVNQNGQGDGERNACTAPQLRRFIKSRAYVPMHELRRRFGIEGEDDDVTGVDMGSGAHVYVGLPRREGLLLGELLRARDVGYELSFDPISPIVVGVFPMRPIPRS